MHTRGRRKRAEEAEDVLIHSFGLFLPISSFIFVFIKPVIERRVTLFKKSLNSKSQKEADGVNVHISYSLWDAFSPLLVVDFNNLFLEKLPMQGEAFI